MSKIKASRNKHEPSPEKLQTSEIHYRRLFEAARDGILILDAATLQIIDANPFMAELLGYTRDEFLGKELWQIGVFSDKEASKLAFRDLQKTRYLRYEDLPLKTTKGEIREVEFISNVYDEDGHAVIQCNIRDITKHKRSKDSLRRGRRQAEHALKLSEADLQALFEYARDGIVIADPNEYYIGANESMCRMLGYTRKELIGMHASDIVTKSELKHIAPAMDVIESASDYYREWQFRRKDGSEFSGEVMATTLPGGGLLAMIRDITERKQAEDDLRESAALLKASDAEMRALFAAMNDVIIVFDYDGRHLKVALTNPAHFYRRGTYRIGKTVHEIFPPDIADFLLTNIQTCLDEGRTLNVEYTLSIEGKDLWFDGTVTPMTDDSAVWVARDITERKHADAAVREKTALLEAQINSTIDGILVVNEAGKQIIQNQQLVELFKIPRDIADDPDDSKQVKWVTGMMKDPEKFVEKVVYLYSHPDEISRDEIELTDGTILDRYSAPVIGKDDKNYGRIWTFRDITEQKQTNNALRESNEKFQQLADNISDVFWIRSLDMSEVYYVSPAFEQIWGRTVESLYADPQEWSNFVLAEDRARVHEAFAGLTSDSTRLDIEYRITRPDGEIRWVRLRGFPVKDAAGILIRYAGIVTDITEKKHSETEIELTMQRLNSAQRLGRIGDWEWNVATDSITWSPEVFEIIGRDPLLGPPKDFEEMSSSYDEPSRELLAANVSTAMESGEAQECELLVVRPDGKRVYVQAVAEPKRGEDGQIFAFAGTIQDISARNFSEAALTESEFRYHSLFENMLEGYSYCQTIFKDDKLHDFVYTEVNGAFETLTGLKDVVGKKVSDIIPGFVKTNPELLETYGRVALTGKPEKFETYVEPLKTWLSITAYSSNRENFVAVFDNITERKLANAALLESEDRYRTLFETAPDGVAMFDLKMNVLMANDRAAGIFGFANAEAMIGINAYDLIAPEHHERAGINIGGMFESGHLLPLESEGLKANGAKFAVEFSATLIRNSEGRPMAVLGVTRDITERKRGEERLRTSEANLAKSQEIAHLGSWEMDLVQNGNVGEGNLRWSDEVFRIFGYQPGEIEVSNERFFERVHPDDRANVTAALAEALRKGTEYRLDHRIVMPDGTERFVHEHAEIISDEVSGAPLKMVGTVQDVTYRTHLEEQFRQSQKMEAVGVLAGGIAHDFNNLLTAINGYSDLTLRKMAADDPLRRNIKEIKDAGDRAAELTAQLLAFSRKQVLKPRVYNLNAAITEIDRMLRRIMRESIELRTVLAPDLGNIKADPGQIEQVIMNLAVNARDAMLKGGSLTIETKNVYLDNDYVSQHMAISPGEFIRLTVTDNGVGMDKEIQRHIFEPFFTTKDVGKGTGLGLSTVYGIVKQSGGDILVYSEPGHGTSFKIYLPCVDQPVEKSKWVDSIEKYSGTETILLVEDEEIVRNLVREVLIDNGYTVLEAASGKAALSVCETYSKPIHMLLTDMVMPKMSGNDLRDCVVKSHPDIKVLFMSGYTDDSIAQSGIFDSDLEFIEKPFTPDSLARKIREVFEY